MERDSMVFYRSFFNAIKLLPKEMQYESLMAIINYGLDGTEDEPNAILEMAKPQIDANNKRFANGKRGGHDKGFGVGNQNATKNEPKTNQEQTENEPKTNQEQTKNEPNVNVNVNVNESVNNARTRAHTRPRREEDVKVLYDIHISPTEKTANGNPVLKTYWAQQWQINHPNYMLYDWLSRFNRDLANQGRFTHDVIDYTSHFSKWFEKQISKQ